MRPSLKELQELRPRGIVVPSTIRFHDRQQIIRGLHAFSLRILDHREVEPRLMILRIGCKLALEFARVSKLLCLLCQVHLRSHSGKLLGFLFVFGRARKNLLGPIHIALLKSRSANAAIASMLSGASCRMAE